MRLPTAFPVSPADPTPWAITGDVVIARQLSRRAIEQRQHARLVSLLEAARRTPRWSARLAGEDLTTLPLQALPIQHKAEALRHFEAGLTDPQIRRVAVEAFRANAGNVGERFLDRYWIWTSSGSTGEPAVYVQDADAMAVYDALEGTRRDSPRPWLRAADPLYWSERFAFAGAIGGHFASHVSMRRLQRAQPWMGNWRCFDLLQPSPALCAALDRYQPTLLATYPTAAVMLADEALAGRLRCRPAEIWTGGETLTPAMRERIEFAFGAAVRNSYGASEFLPIAWECRRGRLHVNADWVILEPVDAKGRPVPPGRTSHTTLLTNLANHVQPIIRLDIGDRIVLDAQPCPCGCALPVVEVQGRADDTLRLAGRDGHPVALLPLALTAVLEEDARVFDFELLQTAPDALQLRLGPAARRARGARDRCRRVLQAFFDQQQLMPVRLTITALAAPDLERSGKRKRILSRAD